MNLTDAALFWIEFIIRQNGASHLRTELNKLPYTYNTRNVVTLVLCGAIILDLIFSDLGTFLLEFIAFSDAVLYNG